jgi:hypothetical protein
VFNERGVQVAEFDILISGAVEDRQMSWLIECRDRPSKGSAPAKWIEQLAGRRSRFGFERVMAVSSTGFSAGAVEAARELHIDLRVLGELTAEEVMGWLPFNAPLIIRKGHMSGVRFFAETSQLLGDLATDAKILFSQTHDEVLSLQDLWRRLTNKNELWVGVEEGGQARNVTVNALELLQEKYDLIYTGHKLSLEEIQIDATLQIVVPWMPLVEAAEYSPASEASEAKKPIAKIGRWRGPDEGIVKELTVIGFLKQEAAGES